MCTLAITKNHSIGGTFDVMAIPNNLGAFGFFVGISKQCMPQADPTKYVKPPKCWLTKASNEVTFLVVDLVGCEQEQEVKEQKKNQMHLKNGHS